MPVSVTNVIVIDIIRLKNITIAINVKSDYKIYQNITGNINN